MMTTAERLAGYYPFAESTIAAVSEFAERQSRYENYSDFLAAAGATDTVKLQFDGYHPVECIDIRPDEHDPAEALIYHLPMANPLDANQLYQISTIAGLHPNKRIIATGNPSAGPYKGAQLNRPQRKAVAKGNLTPVVTPLIKYVEEQDIDKVQEVGYSYGAKRAQSAAAAAEYSVSDLVLLEPVVGKRLLLKLGYDFIRTGKPLKGYVDAVELPTFKDARHDSVTPAQFNRSIFSLSNIAIARALTRPDFANSTSDAFLEHPEMQLTVAWGSESEMAKDKLLRESIRQMSEYRSGQIYSMRMVGQRHALANDIHLQAAIIFEALSHPV